MWRLFWLLYPIIATALAGGGVTLALVWGVVSATALVAAAAAGALIAVPVSLLVLRGLMG